jgi:uncharacterized protein YkwD
MRKSLISALAFLLLNPVFAQSQQEKKVAEVFIIERADAFVKGLPRLIIAEINGFRAEQGLARLGENQCLTQAAQYHAAWMAAAQTGGHTESRAVGDRAALAEPRHRFAKYGCNGFGENVLGWYPAGETLAQTAKSVVQAWKDSPLHRELMLCPQMDGQVVIGIGIAGWVDGSGASYCLTFGLK